VGAKRTRTLIAILLLGVMPTLTNFGSDG
jgi:hypothetical protein